MDLTHWFRDHLTSGRDEFIWALGEVPEERRSLAPPAAISDWSAHQHLYHLWVYEQYLPLPVMQGWLPEPLTMTEAMIQESQQRWRDQEEQWHTIGWDELISRFTEGRNAQIALLNQFSKDDWHRVLLTQWWDDQSLKWVVSKTFQHTAEHTCTVMRMVLFWDF